MSNRFRSTQVHRLAREAFAGLTVVVAVSCTDNAATDPNLWIPYSSPPAVRIEVDPTSVNLRTGSRATLHAQAFDSSGRAVTATLSWNSSDPSIATVTRSGASDGIVTAIAAGEATITVSSPSLTANVKVTVGPPEPAASLHIFPEEVLLGILGEAQLIARGDDASGRPTVVAVQWTSQNPGVATVDKVTGIVTAVGFGATQITATVGNVSASIPVRVEPPEFLMQWAAAATASSSYSNDPDIWSAWQATGEPNVTSCDEEAKSWASLGYNEDWLELTYTVPVRPAEIRIHEVWAPGSIVKVEVKDVTGIYHVVYQANPQLVPGCLRRLTIPVDDVTELVNAVRVTVDQRKRQDWNEIDAVRLSGYRKP